MDEATSRGVKMLRFPLILMVLYIHSFIAPVTYGHSTVAVTPASWIMVLATALSGGFARIAVPLFFLISGYLYFFDFDGSFVAYRNKTRRRVSTLLIPYLFWNLFTLALTATAQAIPMTAGYFNASNTHVADATIFGLIDTALGVTHYPIAYPFWFIRDLIVIVLFTPIIYWLIDHLGVIAPLLLVLAWGILLLFGPVDWIEGAAFFVVGAWLAMGRKTLFQPARWLCWLGPCYAVALGVDVTQRVLFPDMQLFYAVTVATGVVLLLALTSFLLRGAAQGLARNLIALSGASFFVFAAHEPLMTLTRKLLYRMAPPSQTLIFLSYVGLPLLIATSLTFAYFALQRIAPKLTSIISGGR